MPPDPSAASSSGAAAGASSSSKGGASYRERVFWTPEEDALLLKLVAIHGASVSSSSVALPVHTIPHSERAVGHCLLSVNLRARAPSAERRPAGATTTLTRPGSSPNRGPPSPLPRSLSSRQAHERARQRRRERAKTRSRWLRKEGVVRGWARGAAGGAPFHEREAASLGIGMPTPSSSLLLQLADTSCSLLHFLFFTCSSCLWLARPSPLRSPRQQTGQRLKVRLLALFRKLGRGRGRRSPLVGGEAEAKRGPPILPFLSDSLDRPTAGCCCCCCC